MIQSDLQFLRQTRQYRLGRGDAPIVLGGALNVPSSREPRPGQSAQQQMVSPPLQRPSAPSRMLSSQPTIASIQGQISPVLPQVPRTQMAPRTGPESGLLPIRQARAMPTVRHATIRQRLIDDAAQQGAYCKLLLFGQSLGTNKF